MKINTAEFVVSNTDIKKLPKPDKPEFAFIGSTVGLLAASLAHIAATLIAQRLFGLTLGIPFSTWVISVAIGTSLMLVIGWLSERRLLQQPPTQQFRR